MNVQFRSVAMLLHTIRYGVIGNKTKMRVGCRINDTRATTRTTTNVVLFV
jgi:hypothetical protein